MDLIAEEEEEQVLVPDPVSWSDGELPDEIAAKIQARLPLVSLVELRAVCRAWKKNVEWPGLLQERVESGAGAQDLMLFVAGFLKKEWRNAWCTYDPASDRWYKLQLPPGLRSLIVQGAGGGVLLYNFQPGIQPDYMGQTVLQIGNPVARSWARLPAFPDGLRDIALVQGVFVDAVAKSFKLVVVNEEQLALPTFVFDSALGTWSVTTWGLPGALGPMYELPFIGGQGVFVGTVLYCFSYCIIKAMLVAYDLERPGWSRFALAKPVDLDVLYSNLINVRDRLLCAACVMTNSTLQCLQIWDMDFARRVWTEVDSMPAPIFTLWEKGLVCRPSFYYGAAVQAVAGGDEVYVMHDKVDKIAALDLRQTPPAWRWLPSLPYQDFQIKSYHSLHPWLEFGSGL